MLEGQTVLCLKDGFKHHVLFILFYMSLHSSVDHKHKEWTQSPQNSTPFQTKKLCGEFWHGNATSGTILTHCAKFYDHKNCSRVQTGK